MRIQSCRKPMGKSRCVLQLIRSTCRQSTRLCFLFCFFCFFISVCLFDFFAVSLFSRFCFSVASHLAMFSNLNHEAADEFCFATKQQTKQQQKLKCKSFKGAPCDSLALPQLPCSAKVAGRFLPARFRPVRPH